MGTKNDTMTGTENTDATDGEAKTDPSGSVQVRIDAKAQADGSVLVTISGALGPLSFPVIHRPELAVSDPMRWEGLPGRPFALREPCKTAIRIALAS